MPWCFRAPSKPFVLVITWLLIIYQPVLISNHSRLRCLEGYLLSAQFASRDLVSELNSAQSPSGTSSAIGSWSEGACIRNRLCQLLPYGTDLILPLRSLATIFLFQDQQAWTPAWFATTFWRSWSSRHMSSAKDILGSVSALLAFITSHLSSWN